MTRAKTMLGLPALAAGVEGGEGGDGETVEDEVTRKRYEKRVKVVREVWESERVYVEGLEVVIKVSPGYQTRQSVWS